MRERPPSTPAPKGVRRDCMEASKHLASVLLPAHPEACHVMGRTLQNTTTDGRRRPEGQTEEAAGGRNEVSGPAPSETRRIFLRDLARLLADETRKHDKGGKWTESYRWLIASRCRVNNLVAARITTRISRSMTGPATFVLALFTTDALVVSFWLLTRLTRTWIDV